jgi:hypothetical protein
MPTVFLRAAWRLHPDFHLSLRGVVQGDSPAKRSSIDENQAALFEGQPQLCLGCAMDIMAIALVIPDRAAGDAGAIGKLGLRPIEETAGRPAQSRR